MKLSALAFGAIVLALTLPLQAAEIYKRELPDGSVVYGDQPDPEARKIEPPPTQVVPSFKPAPAAPDRGVVANRIAQQVTGYEDISIASPGEDEVIWNNENLLDVTVDLRPPLRTRAGHSLVLLMDGKPVARSRGEVSFHLKDVFRGSHELQAAVEDRTGIELQRSEPRTFHVRQASIQAPPRTR